MDPEPASPWTPNRLSNRSFLDHFFALLILLQTPPPIFIVFSCKWPSRMLNISAQFSSKFQTLENQFEQGSGRFVDTEPPFKMGPQIRAEQKKTKTPKKNEQHETKRFFLQKGAFLEQKKVVFIFDGLGRLKKKTKTSNRRCAKNTTKQGVLFIFVLVLRHSFLPKTTLQQNKTTYTK